MTPSSKHAKSGPCGFRKATNAREAKPGGKAIELQNLIPIAVVIAAGCESCAEAVVMRALNQGSAPLDIEATLRIVAYMRTLECFIEGAGQEAVSRMEVPAAIAARTLQQAKA